MKRIIALLVLATLAFAAPVEASSTLVFSGKTSGLHATFSAQVVSEVNGIVAATASGYRVKAGAPYEMSILYTEGSTSFACDAHVVGVSPVTCSAYLPAGTYIVLFSSWSVSTPVTITVTVP